MNDFSFRLKVAMDHRGMKATDLAKATNLNKGIISKYLNNKYKPKTKDNTNKIKKLNQELDRLNILFQKSRISEEYYNQEYDKIKVEIDSLKSTPKKNIKLEKDWRKVYESLSREGKRTFWRSFIDKIIIDPQTYKTNNPKIIFK